MLMGKIFLQIKQAKRLTYRPFCLYYLIPVLLEISSQTFCLKQGKTSKNVFNIRFRSSWKATGPTCPRRIRRTAGIKAESLKATTKQNSK